MTPAVPHYRCPRCGDLIQRIMAGSFDRLVYRACGDQALLAPAPAREDRVPLGHAAPWPKALEARVS